MSSNLDDDSMRSSSEDRNPPDFAQIANAYRTLANQYEGFVANPTTLTPDGVLLLEEIRNMRAEMRQGFERVEERFERVEERFVQIEKRRRAE